MGPPGKSANYAYDTYTTLRPPRHESLDHFGTDENLTIIRTESNGLRVCGITLPPSGFI
jgi:hypothetical protein